LPYARARRLTDRQHNGEVNQELPLKKLPTPRVVAGPKRLRNQRRQA
jgi:hypothetical protein